MNATGLGCSDFTLAVCIENRPAFADYESLDDIRALQLGEIYAIGQQCGNGWRKVFNVYAKLIEALKPTIIDYPYPSWQGYRDKSLLQQGSQTALLFSPPPLQARRRIETTKTARALPLYIIPGRAYAKSLYRAIEADTKEPPLLNWLDKEFAIDVKNRTIVCPYFDYRQLSNIKIERLARELLKLHSDE